MFAQGIRSLKQNVGHCLVSKGVSVARKLAVISSALSGEFQQISALLSSHNPAGQGCI